MELIKTVKMTKIFQSFYRELNISPLAFIYSSDKLCRDIFQVSSTCRFVFVHKHFWRQGMNDTCKSALQATTELISLTPVIHAHLS